MVSYCSKLAILHLLLYHTTSQMSIPGFLNVFHQTWNGHRQKYSAELWIVRRAGISPYVLSTLFSEDV